MSKGGAVKMFVSHCFNLFPTFNKTVVKNDSKCSSGQT